MSQCFSDANGQWWITESVWLTSAADILAASAAIQSGEPGPYGCQNQNGVLSYFKNQTRRATDSDVTQALSTRNREQRIQMLFGSEQSNTTFDDILSR
ncbi:hypothetical protein N7453_000592 [Penicillium expansum]|nr:hypothetical protein N7453_000592 [Penicillium expansum]